MQIPTLCLMLVACGGTASDGSVEGRKFNGTTAWGNITQQAVHVVIEENVNVCTNKSAAGGKRNTIDMELSSWNGNQLVPPTSAGTFVVEQSFCKDNDGKIQSECGLSGKPVPAGARYATVKYTRDADVPAVQALAGFVRVNSIATSVGGQVSGEYELFLDTGDRVAGSFSSNLCEL